MNDPRLDRPAPAGARIQTVWRLGYAGRIAGLLVGMLILSGCGTSAAPGAADVASPAPATQVAPPTSTSIPPTATPVPPSATPLPPSPTATPTLSPTPMPPEPQPGATLSGAMQQQSGADAGTAASGTIKLTVDNDGKSIASVSVEFMKVSCGGMTSDSLAQNFTKPVAVEAGAFMMPLGAKGSLKGQFSAPTQAEGTLAFVLDIPLSGVCDLGTWTWSASATP